MEKMVPTKPPVATGRVYFRGVSRFGFAAIAWDFTTRISAVMISRARARTFPWGIAI
jgi:hypothetical protein